MTTDITSPKWRGERAAPIDPASVRFTARETGDSCTGCLFASQSSRVCDQVHDIARDAGLPLCVDTENYIYILDKSDPRQLPLVELDTE